METMVCIWFYQVLNVVSSKMHIVKIFLSYGLGEDDYLIASRNRSLNPSCDLPVSGLVVEYEYMLIIDSAKVNIATTHSNSVPKEMTVEGSFCDIHNLLFIYCV